MSGGICLAGTALRELRIHLCQKSPASAGVRAFIENDYVPLKKANPQCPILIREASGIAPRVFARYERRIVGLLVFECHVYFRYEHGVERSVQLEDMSQANVAAAIKDLSTRQ